MLFYIFVNVFLFLSGKSEAEKLFVINIMKVASRGELEWQKDEEVLRKLRIKKIYVVYKIKGISAKKFREVLILTDRDKKGKKIYKY